MYNFKCTAFITDNSLNGGILNVYVTLGILTVILTEVSKITNTFCCVKHLNVDSL